MKKRKKLLIMILCAALILSVSGFAAHYIYRHAYADDVFDKTYNTNFNVYSYFTATYGSAPTMYLDKDGSIYTYELKDEKYEPIHVADWTRRITLTEKNFDDLLVDGKSWMAANTDAQSLREDNVATWVYENEHGILGYIMLQKSGHVLLCTSPENAETGIDEIVLLGKLGDSSVFFDFLDSLNSD